MRKKIKLLALLLIFVFICSKITSGFKATARQFCKYEVNNALNAELNRQILDFAIENRTVQNSICNFGMQNGAIRSISVNSHAVSVMSAEICGRLIEAIRDFGNSGFGIPLGNVTGLMTLSGKGPKIKIKTVPLGNIACDTESQFISAGINQTHFKLVLKITCAYEASAPFSSESGQLSFSYTLCEAIIVGDVPQLYFD